MAVARSSSGGVALRYVLPVLWITSRLAIVGRTSVHALSLAKYSVRHSVAIPGRESDACECLFKLRLSLLFAMAAEGIFIGAAVTRRSVDGISPQ